MRRQLRVGRRQAIQKELRCAGAVSREPVAESYPRYVEAVASDLVDCAGVEVVHQRVAVVVERGGTNGRQGSCDRIEHRLHRLVDRCPPVGEPCAPSVLQLRVEEPFADGTGGKLENGEGGPSRAAQLELGRRLGGEVDQLGESDSAGSRTMAELRQVGDGGDPQLEPTNRQRSVGAAFEHSRADVLLPQDFEGSALGIDVGLDRLWCGHEPFRIRAAEDAAVKERTAASSAASPIHASRDPEGARPRARPPDRSARRRPRRGSRGDEYAAVKERTAASSAASPIHASRDPEGQ